MTATAAAVGYGAEFAIGDGGDPTETFTKVAEVRAITPPAFTRDSDEATRLDSPDEYKEYVAAMFDTGDVSITLNYVPTASASDVLFTALHADAGNFQITFPNGVRMQFTGFFVGYEPAEIEPNGTMTLTAMLKRSTGKPLLLAAET